MIQRILAATAIIAIGVGLLLGAALIWDRIAPTLALDPSTRTVLGLLIGMVFGLGLLAGGMPAWFKWVSRD